MWRLAPPAGLSEPRQLKSGERWLARPASIFPGSGGLRPWTPTRRRKKVPGDEEESDAIRRGLPG